MTDADRPDAIVVFPGYFSSGIWEIYPGWHPLGGDMVAHEELGLPSDLANRFDALIERWTWHHEDPDFDWDAFNAEWEALVRELKRVVGNAVRVHVPDRGDRVREVTVDDAG